jgi:hypothetical protein
MNDLKIGPLSLKFGGYANDLSGDFYADNWLNVVVTCTTEQGQVAFTSPCLMTTDIYDFVEELDEFLSGKGRHACLVSLEPQVDVRLSRGADADTFEIEIELTPDAEADEDISDATATVTRADVDRVAVQAKQIIEQGGGNISEIAYATGFNSVSYFSFSFKNYFGYPPTDLIPKNAGFI